MVELKEVKLRPKTDDHDLHVKLRHARRFLETGNKVKFTVRFRGREITHPERARMQLDWLVEHLEDLANVEQRPTMEGRTMSMIVAAKPQVLQKLQQLKAQRQTDALDSSPEHENPSDADSESDADSDDERDGDERDGDEQRSSATASAASKS